MKCVKANDYIMSSSNKNCVVFRNEKMQISSWKLSYKDERSTHTMQAFLNNKKQIFIMKPICPKHMAEVQHY